MSGILSRIHECGKQISDGLLFTTRNHFKQRYPDSKHYDPDKVLENFIHNGINPAGGINIDVPGITRAYSDITIKPKFRKWLTIPLHRTAYGKKVSDFNDLFVKTKNNGQKYLVQKTAGGHLTYLFRLVK